MSTVKLPFKKQENPPKKKKATWPPPKKKWPRVLGFSVIFLIILCIVVELWPQKKPDDYLTYTQRYVPSSVKSADFLLNIGTNVHGVTVQPELWQNGQCTLGDAMQVDEQDPQMHILISTGELNNAKGIPSVQVQLDKSNTDESVLTRFLLSTSVQGYLYSTYSDHEILEAKPGESIVLATVGLNTGSGSRAYSCAVLSQDESQIRSAPCLILIRATFTEDSPASNASVAQSS